VLSYTIRAGSIPTLEWFLSKSELVDRLRLIPLNEAAYRGQFEVVKWLYGQGHALDSAFGRYAPLGGNLDMVQRGIHILPSRFNESRHFHCSPTPTKALAALAPAIATAGTPIPGKTPSLASTRLDIGVAPFGR